MLRRKGCVIGVFLMLLLASAVSFAKETKQQQYTADYSLSKDITFIIGTVLGPEDFNGTTTARALYLFQYDSGFFVDKMGVVRGFTMV